MNDLVRQLKEAQHNINKIFSQMEGTHRKILNDCDYLGLNIDDVLEKLRIEG